MEATAQTVDGKSGWQVTNTPRTFAQEQTASRCNDVEPWSLSFNVGAVGRESVQLAIFFSFQNPLACFNIKIRGGGEKQQTQKQQDNKDLIIQSTCILFSINSMAASDDGTIAESTTACNVTWPWWL
jgi:hypothetical protein